MSYEGLDMSLIWAFSREAGGAEVVAPVVKALMKKHRVLLLAKDYAKSIFAKHSLPFTEVSGYSANLVRSLIDKHGRPSLVLTSAASLPWRDMTEKYLWQWSAGENIPSIAILDQWHTYALRFSGVRKNERLKYLPDCVCVMDEYAKKDMILEGIPPTKVVVTGQPAFDAILEHKKTFSKKKCLEIRKKIGVRDEKIVLFVSESLKHDFGNSLGYTEATILKAVLNALKGLTEEGHKLTLIVKLHPQNKKEDFDAIDFGAYRRSFGIKFIQREIPPRDLVLCSDVVVGMTSVLLVESILLGKPTLSLQINAKKNDALIATRIRAIPLISNAKEFEKVLRLILTNKKYRAAYLEKQKRLRVRGQSTKNIIQLVEKILKERKLINLG
jgi:hypothetical protein